MKQESGGLLLLRRITPLARRNAVYFRSGAYSLIGIPSTQGRSLFLNCLVAHEIGEYVYSEKLLDDQLRPEVKAALGLVYGVEYETKDKTQKSGLVDTVISWAKELFCDLFAVYLVGPCYTFAYIELFDLPNLLDKSGTIAATKPKPPIQFYPLHPSHPFRIKYQADLLKRLEWWPQIRSIDSRYLRVLESLSDLGDNDFIDADDVGTAPLVEAFFKIIPEINSHLGRIVGSLDTGVHEFGQLREHITHYLQEGIVPSTITIQVGSDESQQVTPSAVALLNSFACFYLENVERLMDRVEGQDKNSLERRIHWIRKLEGWTSKALEDITLSSES